MPNLRALRNAGKPISTGPFAMLASSNHPLDCLKSQNSHAFLQNTLRVQCLARAMACTQRPGCQTVNPPEEPILRSPEGISCPQCSKVDLAVVERSQQRERIANARL